MQGERYKYRNNASDENLLEGEHDDLTRNIILQQSSQFEFFPRDSELTSKV